MLAQNTWRRWTLLVVAVALLVPAPIFPGQKHKKKNNKESLPDGIPVLWQAPSDIAKRDLYWGQGGKAMQPDLRTVTLPLRSKPIRDVAITPGSRPRFLVRRLRPERSRASAWL